MARLLADPLQGLNVFVCCAEQGSFTRAGQLLGLTPSAVSKAMSRLEQELGSRLFQRSPRAVTLTAEGSEFFARCRELVDQAEAARQTLAGAAVRARGQLRVSSPVSFGQFVLSPALAEWLRRQPELGVQLSLSDRVPDLVEERLDLAIRLGEPPDSRLVARRIGEMPFVLVASAAYLRARGRPRRPQDLSDHACLGYVQAWDGALRRWSFTRGEDKLLHLPRGPLASGHVSVLLDAALAGAGIAQLPRFVAAEVLAQGRLKLLMPEYASFGPPLYALYSPRRQNSAALQSLLGLVSGLADRL